MPGYIRTLGGKINNLAQGVITGKKLAQLFKTSSNAVVFVRVEGGYDFGPAGRDFDWQGTIESSDPKLNGKPVAFQHGESEKPVPYTGALDRMIFEESKRPLVPVKVGRLMFTAET